MAGKTYTPADVTAATGISSKTVRDHLRKTYTRAPKYKNTTWILNAKMFADTVAAFKKRNPEAYAKAQKARAKRTAPKRTANTAPTPTIESA
jgi:predicted site-specific integrase-resolvase